MKPLDADSKRSSVKVLPPKFGRHIAIVATKTDDLKETGFGTIKTCKTFYENLQKRYARVTFHQVNKISSLDDVVHMKPDFVVLCSKYFIDPETQSKVWFSEYFLIHKILFSGSDRKALEFDSNKSKAKTVLKNEGIATAKYFLASPDQYSTEDRLPIPLPVFIKPLDAANGFGIDEHSIARDFETYQRKVAELFILQGTKVLVEEMLPGREFTVAVFDDASNGQRWTMPMEIIPPINKKGDRILGYNEKQENKEELRFVDGPLSTNLNELASKVFTSLGARDFGRIDIKLDVDGEPNFLEINLVPGMTTGSSYFPYACSLSGKYNEKEKIGMTDTDVANKIVELGLKRLDMTTN